MIARLRQFSSNRAKELIVYYNTGMEKANILFIEDDQSGREMGVFNLQKAGYNVQEAASGEEGLSLFKADLYDLVITDVRMPGISGMELLTELKQQAPDLPVIVITAYANVDLAVEAMKAGACDFIGKPFSRDHLVLKVEKALQRMQLVKEVEDLKIQAHGVGRQIIYRSAAMRQVMTLVDKVAQADATVLVTGESGSGKELVARRIHIKSPRASGPFVVVNAAAMPKDLLESELFGHEKGAFTGALNSRVGRFRQADAGTLFLDEIAELPLGLQGKLLRVLQERVVDVLGKDEPVPVDVRVVVATNRDLKAVVNAGHFREDLYYRINVVEVEVPPLRKRTEDIEPLARHFVSYYAAGRELTIPDALIAQLLQQRWPGNVRELQNTCQRLAILAPEAAVRVADLPPGSDAAQEADDFGDWPPLPNDGLSLVDLERRVIERVLAMKQGNVTQAARYLQIPRHVLAYRMEKYGIARKS